LEPTEPTGKDILKESVKLLVVRGWGRTRKNVTNSKKGHRKGGQKEQSRDTGRYERLRQIIGRSAKKIRSPAKESCGGGGGKSRPIRGPVSKNRRVEGPKVDEEENRGDLGKETRFWIRGDQEGRQYIAG